MSIELYLLIATTIIIVAAVLYWQCSPTVIIADRHKQQSHGRLTQQQRQAFLNTLTKLPIGNINISAIRDDFDSFNFANELSHLLKKAGWQTSEVRPVNFVINPKGLIITVNNLAKSPVYASALQRSLKDIGLNFYTNTNSKIPENTLNLFVGLRPNPIN